MPCPEQTQVILIMFFLHLRYQAPSIALWQRVAFAISCLLKLTQRVAETCNNLTQSTNEIPTRGQPSTILHKVLVSLCHCLWKSDCKLQGRLSMPVQICVLQLLAAPAFAGPRRGRAAPPRWAGNGFCVRKVERHRKRNTFNSHP